MIPINCLLVFLWICQTLAAPVDIPKSSSPEDTQDKRQNSVKFYEVDILHNGFKVYSVMKFGQRQQPIVGIIDSGSSLSWVPAPGSRNHHEPPMVTMQESMSNVWGKVWGKSATSNVNAFKNNRKPAVPNYEFDVSEVKATLGDFELSYDSGFAIGQKVKGNIFLQPLLPGSKPVEIPNAEFGVATSTSSEMGIFGVGYDGGDASMSILTSMVKSGLIAQKSYSIFYNLRAHKAGSILFGGADLTKFKGQMTMHMLQLHDSHLQVVLDKMTYNNVPLLSRGMYALLDTGYTVISLPKTVKFGNFKINHQGYYTAPCGSRLADLHFTFGATTITVPLTSLLTNNRDANGECLLEIQVSESPSIVLGGAFLQFAYIYQDIGNQYVGIAQAVTNILDAAYAPATPQHVVLPGTRPLTGLGK